MDELNQHHPELGETILFCGHYEETEYHFFAKTEEDDSELRAVVVKRCEEEPGFQIRWIILCDDCTRQRTKHDGVHPFEGPLHKAMWAPDNLNVMKN